MRVSDIHAREISVPCLLLAMMSLFGSNCDAEVITFESLTIPAAGFYNGNIASTGTERDNFTILGTRDNFGSPEFLQEWTIEGVTFNNYFTDFGGFDSWTGWSWSNVRDSNTAGFTNQYAARPGGGAGDSSTYLVAFGSGAYFDVPINKQLDSVELTNTTYTARYIADGTDGFGTPDADPEARYGGPSRNDPDYFRVILSGYTGVAGSGSLIDEVRVDLADYSFNDPLDDFVVTEWMKVGLSSITDARSVSIRFDTNDIGPFGPDTPYYIALDNLTFVASVPEPNSFSAIAFASLIVIYLRRFRSGRARFSCRMLSR